MNGGKELDARELVSAVVAEAEKRGAEMVEAYYQRSEDLTIEVRNGEVETLKIAGEEGLGIRVIKGKSLGFAYTSDLSWSSVKETIDAALANLQVASEDSFNILPEAPSSYPELDLLDPALREVPLEEKIEKARAIERAGRSFDPRVRLTDRVSYEDSWYQVAIGNSRGILASHQGAFCGGSAVLVAESEGEQQTGFSFQLTRRYHDFDPEEIGQEAALKAVRMLGARPRETMKVPIVFDPYVVTNFLGLLATALTAEAVQKGRSLFAGRVGEKVAASGITIIDDSLLDGGILSAPFDGEGVPGQRKLLIKDGYLRGFLHNAYTAAKDGVASTGNALRASYKVPPEVGSSNFFLAPGKMKNEEIIRNTERGLYLTEVMGMHTANPISGDFSVGAAGIWIEGGELTKPVRGMVIAGNIIRLLEMVDAVGSEVRFFGGRGAPVIRVHGLTLSG